MTLAAALLIGVLFGAGAFLLLEEDLVRMAAGALLTSQAANAFLMAVGLSRGRAPIHPVGPDQASDPVAQALTLTAIVITFGIAGLLLALVLRVDATHRTIAAEDVLHAEEEAEAAGREENEAGREEEAER